LTLAALLGVSGCNESMVSENAGRRLVVFVQAPRGALSSTTESATFRDPYPSGSRVVVWDPTHPDDAPRVLTRGFESAGAPAASPEGTHVLFCGRRSAKAPWRIFEMPVEGGPAAAVSPAGANATGAAYLPGGRVVFAGDLERGRDPQDSGPAYSLYTCRRDGSDLARITFNPASDIDPTVLDDGRILYAAWQPPGVGRPRGGWALFTVKNDGTGVFGFYGSHDAPGGKRRPRQVGHRVVFVVTEGAGDAEHLSAVSLRRPLHSLQRIAPETGGAWRSAEAWDEESLLVSYRPGSSGRTPSPSYGLYRLAGEGESVPERVLDDPELDEIDAILVRPRRPPRGRVSMVNPKATTGELLCLDARFTDRLPTSAAGPDEARSLLVFQADPETLDDPIRPHGHSSAASSPPPLPSRLIATLPLAEDGSVFFTVPADTPLRFRTVDGNGQTILDSGGWVWVRPGERRSCIGCHEDRELAPPNRVPEALAGGPRPTREPAMIGARR